MAPDLTRRPPPDLLMTERAFAWTLGTALVGASVYVGEPGQTSVGAVIVLLAYGALGWIAAHVAGEGPRLGLLAFLGTLLSLPAAVHRADGPGWVMLAAAFVGVGLAALGWTLEGRLATLGQRLDDADRAASFSARWLFVVCALVFVGSLLAHSAPLAVASSLVATFSVVRWALAHDRLADREDWLSRVRDGREPGWGLEPRAPFEPAASWLPIYGGHRHLDGVIVRGREAGPYRASPVALAPLTDGPAVPAGWRLPRARAAVALLAAFVAPWLIADLTWWAVCTVWRRAGTPWEVALVLSSLLSFVALALIAQTRPRRSAFLGPAVVATLSVVVAEAACGIHYWHR
ncbi:MAG: hypothetical protein AB7S26_28235 [Sandaracinaceae bacterium]